MYLIGFYSKKNLYKLNKFEYYKNSFSDLKKDGINIIYFYNEDKNISLDKVMVKNINNMGIKLIPFNNQLEIVDNLSGLKGKVFINTFEEQEIRLVNQIRSALRQKITDNPEMFLNKYLQRSIIGNVYPETTISYRSLSIDELSDVKTDDIKAYPYIMKPSGGIQSSGVSKIDNYSDYENGIEYVLNSVNQLKEKKLADQKILLEEFIDGNMYTIDYYVDENQNIFSSKPVMVKLGTDYGINDFCNIVRIISEDVEKKVDEEKLNDFISKTVIGGDIRNTFIHHEFKINSKGEFKNIETNGRIGGYRLDMYQLGYGINLLKLPFIKKNNVKYNLKNNVAIFVLYPKKDGIFSGFNEELINLISKLKSFYRINKVQKNIGDKIGLTKNGYEKLGSIALVNNNLEQFTKDIEWLENIYFDIINVK